MHKEESLSFKDVVTFNLDEYYPMMHGTCLVFPSRLATASIREFYNSG